MSDDDEKTEFSDEGLARLVKAVKKMQGLRVNVGILNDSMHVGKGNAKAVSNALLGSWHEFGTFSKDGAQILPARSFLRVPIIDNLNKRLDEAGILDEAALAQVVKTSSFTAVMLKIGVVAEGIVSDAFDSGGFGKWPASQMKGKKNQQTLVETQQLRNSITSEVTETGGDSE